MRGPGFRGRRNMVERPSLRPGPSRPSSIGPAVRAKRRGGGAPRPAGVRADGGRRRGGAPPPARGGRRGRAGRQPRRRRHALRGRRGGQASSGDQAPEPRVNGIASGRRSQQGVLPAGGIVGGFSKGCRIPIPRHPYIGAAVTRCRPRTNARPAIRRERFHWVDAGRPARGVASTRRARRRPATRAPR